MVEKSVLKLASEGRSVNFISESTGLTRTQIANILILSLSDSKNDGASEQKKSPGVSLTEHHGQYQVTEESVDKNNKEYTIKYSGHKKTLEELISELEIDSSIWDVTSVTYNEWDGMRPNDRGTIKLHQIKVSLRRKVLVANYEIPSAIRIELPSVKAVAPKTPKKSNIKTAVVLPDMQVGFKRDLITGKLTSLHDRRAMDVALQITKYVKPDRIVLLGDNLDLPQESKYPTGPEFYFTTQAAAVELSWWLAQLRQIDPGIKIDYIAGNHDMRAEKVLMQNAVSAYGLRSADDLNGPPLLSVEKLLGLDRLDIEYHSNYPQGKVVLNDNLVCIHGEVAKGESGATVSSVVKDTRVSVIQGHIHRYEVATKTLWGADDKAYMYTAASFGCLCKIDPGAVPGAKAYQNWQQGMGIVYYEDTGLQQFRQEFIPIIDGRAILQNEVFSASEEREIVNLIEHETRFKVS